MGKIFGKFYSFIFKYKWVFGALLGTLMVSVVLENIGPYIMKLLVDAATTGQFGKIGKLLLYYVGARMAANLIDALSYTIGDGVMIPASRDARIKIFKYIQDLDFAYHVNKNTGSLISAFKRGDGAFYSLFFNLHQEVLRTVLGLVVVLFFFAGVDQSILWLMVAMAAANGTAMYWLIRLNMKQRKEFNDAEDNISGIITDNLINYETVKFFAQEKAEEGRLRKTFENWTKKFWGFANSFRVMDITVGTISNLGMFLILGVAINRLKQGTIGVGDFVMVSSFVVGFYYRFFGLFFQMRNIVKAFIDIEKYFEILDQRVEVKDPENPKEIKNIEGKIEFKKVSFAYPGNRKKVVENFDLKIEPGESVAFVGRSGAGKTTLVKLLLRFYDLKKGKIVVDGTDIRQMNKGYLRSLLAVVPQEPILFNNTIGFNIGYGKENVNMREIRAAAKEANLAEFIESLSKKYETQVGERGIKLSGGQKQRLAIARAMLCDPKILIFDEATSNLDSESERLIQEALWKTAKDRTLLIIAHRFSTIRRADKIVVLQHGRVVEAGKHEELVKIKEGVYQKLWTLQAKGKLPKDEGGIMSKR